MGGWRGGGGQNTGGPGLGTATQRLRGFIPFHDAGLCNSEPALLLCLVVVEVGRWGWGSWGEGGGIKLSIPVSTC